MAEVSDDSMPGLGIARLGDPTASGGAITTGDISVLIEGVAVARLGDVVTDPLLMGCGQVSTHAPNVYAVSSPVARQLDRAAPSAGAAAAGRPGVLGPNSRGETLEGDPDGSHAYSRHAMSDGTQHAEARIVQYQGTYGDDVANATSGGVPGRVSGGDYALGEGRAMLSQSSEQGFALEGAAEATLARVSGTEMLTNGQGSSVYASGLGRAGTARASGTALLGRNPETGDAGVGVQGELMAAALEGEVSGGWEFPFFGCRWGGNVTGGGSLASLGAGGRAEMGWDGTDQRYELGLGGKLAALVGLKADVELWGTCASDAPESGAQGGGPAQIARGASTVIVGDR
ncbi:MAG: PAAR domain-containing protein [Myxococcota bacterium]|nr:PAAR domain-containing protein [Myxococcota bacterium]